MYAILLILSVIALGASFIPIFQQPRFPVKRWHLWVVSAIFFLGGFVATSLISVPKENIGLIYKKWGGVSNTDGVISKNGENGRQAKILSEGMAWHWWVNVNNTVTYDSTFVVPDGMVGTLTALDGQPLVGEEFIAPDWVSPDQEQYRDSIETNMLDAKYFLENGGRKGPQLNVLEPGEYKINTYLFRTKLERATTIPPGYVGVVLSKVGKVPDDIQRAADGGELANPVVGEGFRGIRKKVLTPSKYYINTNAYTITKFNTRVQTWKYAGNYKTATIDLEVSENGDITQTREPIEYGKESGVADDAMGTKTKDGWEVHVNGRLLVQIDAEDAPYILSSIGSLVDLENKVITPLVRSQVRNQGELREATEFVTKRSDIESSIEKFIVDEAMKNKVKVKEFRLTSVSIPPELLVPDKRKQLAYKLKQTYKEEQKAFHAKVASSKAKAEAEQQGALVAAQIKKQAAAENKEARRLDGEAEYLYNKGVAKGQEELVNVFGKDMSFQLRLMEFMKELPAQALAAPQFYNYQNGSDDSSDGDETDPMMGMGMYQTLKMLEKFGGNSEPKNDTGSVDVSESDMGDAGSTAVPLRPTEK